MAEGDTRVGTHRGEAGGWRALLGWMKSLGATAHGRGVVTGALWLALLTCGGAQPSGSAGTFDIGSPAPPLSGIEWVTTAPASLAWDGTTTATVVEIWMIACGACRAIMPHLEVLHRKYRERGIRIVSLADNPAEELASFLEGAGGAYTYAIGSSSISGVGRLYQRGFGVGVVPHAYVVSREGRFLWHGHPKDLEPVLMAIVTGRYHMEVERQREAKRRRIRMLAVQLRSGRGDGASSGALEVSRRVLADVRGDAALVYELLRALQPAAARHPQWREVLKETAEELLRLEPGNLMAAQLSRGLAGSAGGTAPRSGR